MSLFAHELIQPFIRKRKNELLICLKVRFVLSRCFSYTGDMVCFGLRKQKSAMRALSTDMIGITGGSSRVCVCMNEPECVS